MSSHKPFICSSQETSHVVQILKFNPRADGAKRRARVLIPPGYLHPGKGKH
jgi:hypothetical protein